MESKREKTIIKDIFPVCVIILCLHWILILRIAKDTKDILRYVLKCLFVRFQSIKEKKRRANVIVPLDVLELEMY